MARLSAVLGVAALLGFGSGAHALVLTIENCPTCNGADISLEVIEGGSGYLATYSIDFTDFDRVAAASPNHMTLTSIGFKAFNKGLVDGDVSFLGSPPGVWGAPIIGEISNAGCTNGSNAGLICASGALAIPDASAGTQLYSWVFDIAANATLKMDEWSIRGSFGPANGWVISESGTPIPEPAAALVFAGGAILVAYRLRKPVR